MARKVYKGRDGKKKYNWMETHVKLKWVGSDGPSSNSSAAQYGDSAYIDVAQHLSLLNRKLIRQGQLFRITNFRLFTQQTTEQLRFKLSVIPRTWMTRNAWVKSKALFDEMNALAAQNVGGSSVYPKWHDYKVYMDSSHRLQPAVDIPLPSDLDDNALTYGTDGEWVYSQFSDSGSSSDNWFVHMLGDHTTVSGNDDNFSSVGIIRAYEESRVVPHAPSPVLPSNMDESPWGRLFGDDDQTGDVFDRLETDNDCPPYHRTSYVGAATMTSGVQVGVGTLSNTNNDKGSLAVRVPNFVAPCGLIRLEIDDVNTWDFESQGIEIEFDVEILGPMDM